MKNERESFRVPPDHFDFLLFKSPWCPIAGDLPFKGGLLRFTGVQTINNCLDIIQGARELLSKTDIKEANSFFQNWEDQVHPFFDIYLGDSGKFSEILPEKFLEYINKYWGRTTLKNHELFSLIAISEAWIILKKIRCDGESEDSPNLLERSRKAIETLNRANDDYLRPDAERGIKDRTVKSKGGKTRVKQARDEQQRWFEKAKELKKEHPEWSISSIANRLEKDPETKQKKQQIEKTLSKKFKEAGRM